MSKFGMTLPRLLVACGRTFFLVVSCCHSSAVDSPKSPMVGETSIARATESRADNSSSVEASRTTSALAASLADSHRAEAAKRDHYRHPLETLQFFGLNTSMKVVELWPGAGWYTEILAPVLRERGELTAVVEAGTDLTPLQQLLTDRPEVFGRVKLVEVKPPEDLRLGPDNSVDLVVTMRNIHTWIKGGYAEQLHREAFRVLKPGGVYGVEEHRANAGTSLEESKRIGYVAEEQLIAMAERAGFVLEARSEINANARDTKDHPSGVWTLPPMLFGVAKADEPKYRAIGESDRMTVKFRKPR